MKFTSTVKLNSTIFHLADIVFFYLLSIHEIVQYGIIEIPKKRKKYHRYQNNYKNLLNKNSAQGVAKIIF